MPVIVRRRRQKKGILANKRERVSRLKSWKGWREFLRLLKRIRIEIRRDELYLDEGD
jgi:transcription initiation factor TFIIIB Brf1 subunit/transcription initiation factor TFIIB